MSSVASEARKTSKQQYLESLAKQKGGEAPSLGNAPSFMAPTAPMTSRAPAMSMAPTAPLGAQSGYSAQRPAATAVDRREQMLLEKRRAFFSGKDNTSTNTANSNANGSSAIAGGNAFAQVPQIQHQFAPPSLFAPAPAAAAASVPSSSSALSAAVPVTAAKEKERRPAEGEPRLSDWRREGFPSEYAYAKHLGLLDAKPQPQHSALPHNTALPHSAALSALPAGLDLQNLQFTTSAHTHSTHTHGAHAANNAHGVLQVSAGYAPTQPLAEATPLQSLPFALAQQHSTAMERDRDRDRERGLGLDIGGDSAQSKDEKRRRQQEYAQSLQQQQQQQYMPAGAVGSAAQQTVGQTHTQSQPQSQGLGLGIGSDLSKEEKRRKQQQYAMELQQQQQQAHKQPALDAVSQRHGVTEPVCGGNVGTAVGANPAKEEKRRRQQEYAQSLQQQQQQQQQQQFMPAGAVGSAVQQVPTQPQPQSQPQPQPQSQSQGLGLDIGSDLSKEEKRRKQQQYAMELQQQQQQAHSHAHTQGQGPQGVSRPAPAPADMYNGNGGAQQGLGIGSDHSKEEKRRKQQQYAMELQQQQMQSKQQQQQAPPSNTQDNPFYNNSNNSNNNNNNNYQFNNGPMYGDPSPQSNPYNQVSMPTNNASRPSEGLGLQIGAERVKDQKRRAQREYAQQLQQQQMNKNSALTQQTPGNRAQPQPQSMWGPPQGQYAAPQYTAPTPHAYAHAQEQVPGMGLAGLGVGQSDKEEKRRKQRDYALALQQQQREKRGGGESSSAHAQNSQQAYINAQQAYPSEQGPNGLPAGMVMGPLGVPVRATLNVGHRGVQKAFNVAHVSPSKDAALGLDRGGLFAEPAMAYTHMQGHAPDEWGPPRGNGFGPAGNFDAQGGMGLGGLGGMGGYPGPAHNPSGGPGMGMGVGGFPHPVGVGVGVGSEGAMNGLGGGAERVREQGLFAEMTAENEEERKRLVRLRQARELEEQIRSERERKEEERRKAAAEEEREAARLARERDELQRAYEAEKQKAQLKAKEDLQRDRERDAELKQKEKAQRQREKEEEDAREEQRVQREREELRRREEEERRREMEKELDRERERERAALPVHLNNNKNNQRETAFQRQERHRQTEVETERQQPLPPAKNAHLFGPQSEGEEEVQSMLFRPQAVQQRKERERRGWDGNAQPYLHPQHEEDDQRTRSRGMFEQKFESNAAFPQQSPIPAQKDRARLFEAPHHTSGENDAFMEYGDSAQQRQGDRRSMSSQSNNRGREREPEVRAERERERGRDRATFSRDDSSVPRSSTLSAPPLPSHTHSQAQLSRPHQHRQQQPPPTPMSLGSSLLVGESQFVLPDGSLFHNLSTPAATPSAPSARSAAVNGGTRRRVVRPDSAIAQLLRPAVTEDDASPSELLAEHTEFHPMHKDHDDNNSLDVNMRHTGRTREDFRPLSSRVHAAPIQTVMNEPAPTEQPNTAKAVPPLPLRTSSLLHSARSPAVAASSRTRIHTQNIASTPSLSRPDTAAHSEVSELSPVSMPASTRRSDMPSERDVLEEHVRSAWRTARDTHVEEENDPDGFDIDRELRKNQRKWALLQRLNDVQPSDADLQRVFSLADTQQQQRALAAVVAKDNARLSVTRPPLTLSGTSRPTSGTLRQSASLVLHSMTPRSAASEEELLRQFGLGF